jgi:uncharacterized protein YdeI (YjbR/CyaY-like superfamily)
MSPAPELPIIPFASSNDWATWIDQHHATSAGLWLKLTKKGSGLPSVTYEEALEVALCYGWIDGQKKGFDDQAWLQKFTPRSTKSIWSKINREKAQRLIENGKMQPAGLKEVERAQQDGRWEAAYDSQRNITIPDDFQAELDQNPAAKDFFATLNSANRYAILFRLQTAKKPETRANHIQRFIEMLEKHEKFHPQENIRGKP